MRDERRVTQACSLPGLQRPLCKTDAAIQVVVLEVQPHVCVCACVCVCVCNATFSSRTRRAKSCTLVRAHFTHVWDGEAKAAPYMMVAYGSHAGSKQKGDVQACAVFFWPEVSHHWSTGLPHAKARLVIADVRRA